MTKTMLNLVVFGLVMNTCYAQSLMDAASVNAKSQLTQNYPTVQAVAPPAMLNASRNNAVTPNNVANTTTPQPAGNTWLKPNPWATTKPTTSSNTTVANTPNPFAAAPPTATNNSAPSSNANIYVTPTATNSVNTAN